MYTYIYKDTYIILYFKLYCIFLYNTCPPRKKTILGKPHKVGNMPQLAAQKAQWMKSWRGPSSMP